MLLATIYDVTKTLFDEVLKKVPLKLLGWQELSPKSEERGLARPLGAQYPLKISLVGNLRDKA